MPKRLFYILLCLALYRDLSAQAVDDSTARQSTAAILNVFYQSLGEQAPIYNGSEYLEYAYTLQEGHPFFASPTWINGDIYLDGMLFHEVPILYDMVKDQVIIQDFQKVYKINLPADKVEGFTLIGHHFVRIVHDSANQVKTGFYDRLYNGKLALFAKREKKISEKYVDLRINNVIRSQDFYYVRKQGIYYSVKSKTGLLGVLKDRKKDVQQYFKKTKIKFKTNPEVAMIKALEYYDQITK